MCKNHKCHYRVIDGVQVHINGDPNMSPDVEAALTQLVRLAHNYVGMKRIEKEHTLMTLGYDDPYKQ